ncbi:hypothetical protein EVAR_49944_1 [Eumeta japonica]|uniref:TIL domain-containing protein n=1 Tax=Eumeta variegata TaxID=151549 RepID=A0A4C1XXF6_EUMVA|nr:hypothetical protein EVAR_49944_1 [Eumeta japonica]
MWCFQAVTPDCVYDDSGLCMQECPADTVSYTSGCDLREVMSRRTCKEPEPRSLGPMCDLSRCDCVEPKVWDEAVSKCVPLEECTKEASGVDETN